MNDPPSLPYPHRTPRGRQPRASSSSPIRQRNTDDILSSLTPRSAVDAFRNPSGSLKECMDAATPAEQAFALRAAIASKNIREWLDEVSSWLWPSTGGSAGFERYASGGHGQLLGAASSPTAKFHPSLSATEVAEYGVRIDQIWQDLDELDVEEIKDQILHNHIRPLSRPGSPLLASSRSVMSSLSSYVRLDDLTTLVTATMVQALPNLSRLTRLLHIWTIRLRVLQKIPVFLASATDAEVALQSGWNAIHIPENTGDKDIAANGAADGSSTTLSQKAYDVMKSILERKVAKAGQHLDFMLNTLESSEETLPEEWIDKVDLLEREYGEWTVVCERMVREADLARNTTEPPVTPVKLDKAEIGESTNGITNTDYKDHVLAEPADPNLFTEAPEASEEIPKKSSSNTDESSQVEDALLETNQTVGSTTPIIKVHLPEDEVKALEESEPESNPASPRVATGDQPIRPKKKLWVGGQEQTPSSMDGSSIDGGYGNGRPVQDSDGSAASSPSLLEALPIDSDYESERSRSDMIDSDLEFDDMLGTNSPQQELPVLPRPRRDSDISTPSTIVYGDQSGFEFSSDPPDHGTPELPCRRDPSLAAASTSTDVSPISTTSAFRSSIRSQSTSFNDMPTVEELPDDESSPKTPSRSTFFPDHLPKDSPSPGRSGTNRAEDQLQQQISEILESVPAKIRLTSEPSAINLNPPDFVKPTARRASKPDPIPRSHSSLSTVSNMSSSRAGTPSFTLAPAFSRNSRTRRQGGNNRDIKLYHLSRANGEAPIKLFIRCVGEGGERVMVRVGGGWADLGEYLKEYACHHGRRSAAAGDTSKVEVKDFTRSLTGRTGTTPPSRPASVQESYSSPPTMPLHIRKTRKPVGAATSGPTLEDLVASQEKELPPKTPLALASRIPIDAQSSGGSTTRSRSRSSSRLSWTEEDSSLGMAGPRAKQIEMSEESKAWVESVKAKVRIASGETRKVSESLGVPGGSSASSLSDAGAASALPLVDPGKFGEMGKVGATKRLFRKQG